MTGAAIQADFLFSKREERSRYTEKEGGDEMVSAAVRPYLMDLGSTNGSFLNGERIDSQRYYELYEKVLYSFPQNVLCAPRCVRTPSCSNC